MVDAGKPHSALEKLRADVEKLAFQDKRTLESLRHRGSSLLQTIFDKDPRWARNWNDNGEWFEVRTNFSDPTPEQELQAWNNSHTKWLGILDGAIEAVLYRHIVSTDEAAKFQTHVTTLLDELMGRVDEIGESHQVMLDTLRKLANLDIEGQTVADVREMVEDLWVKQTGESFKTAGQRLQPFVGNVSASLLASLIGKPLGL